MLEANRAEADLKRVLWQLAFEAHAKGKAGDDQDKLADIGELKLEKSLVALKGGDRNWAHQVIETMKLRAGLLLERAPEVFTFPHRTFQEYLAGAHLAAQSDFAKQACDRLDKQGMFWREAVLLAIGRLVYSLSETARPLELISELCPGQAGDDEVSWHKAWLAGDALLEIGTNRASDSAWGRDLLARVQGRLVDLATGGKLTPRERTSAGSTLARLGDPRAGVTTLERMEFCLVPSGPFWMGVRDEEHLNKRLSYDYRIGRYPVTQAHFSAFVEAGGYLEPRYWREAEAHSVWKSGQVKGWGEDTPRDRPVDYGEPYNLANHPVVGVTWYEALAFTRWLSEQWRDNLPERWGVHLPTEAEWEKAARGGMDIPAEAIILPAGAIHSRYNLSLAGNPQAKRLYPWGNEPDPNRANYDNSRVNASSAVGCFPGGVGPYGCEEMSGNVWEWCHSLYRSYPYRTDDGREGESSLGSRVLRGGAFNDDAYYMRCTFRDYRVPDLRLNHFGFRVVVSPFFSER